MADRITYFESKAGESELKLIGRSSLQDDPMKGLTPADLAAADKNAFDKVNLFIVDLAGRTAGAALIAEFKDEANPLDPLFARLAELCAAYTILATWEEFNYGTERTRDADTARGQLESQRVKDEAMGIMEALRKTRASVKADGTVRKLAFKAGSMGPVVVGPLREGSYFDYTAYFDATGLRRDPIQTDPFKTAGG